jgi:pectate lyase
MTGRFLLFVALIAVVQGCGDGSQSPTESSGGATSATGGATPDTTSSGGSPTGGASSAVTNGGSAIGGAQSSATGGAATGGLTTGGSAAGGVSTGGVTSGGANSGGVNTGGASGAVTTGGSASGGASTGGVAAGGSSAGGTDMGGAATGGAATGGSSTGGDATGGASTGGASTCGVPGPSPLVGWAAVSGNGVTTTTGGGDQAPVTVGSVSEFNSNAGGTDARVICVQTTLSGSVSIGSNKTVIGMSGARIAGHIQMGGSVNVIVRNLTVVGNNCTDSPSDCSSGADAITVNKGAHHLWFDHCDVSDGSDGNLDITQASDFITVSWTKFSYSSARTDPEAGSSGHRFSNLIGADDDVPADETHLNVTFHHVWWADHIDQRMPRMRYGKIHVFNSLYTASGNNYCIGAGMGASVRSEKNVFLGVNKPVNTSSFADGRTTVTSVDNIYEPAQSVPDLGTAFTPTTYYPYTPDPVDTVEAVVRNGAGPQ